ncbi:hypothetical protein E4K64_33540 [Bradyrhizobium frederickii]|uniref:Uncharacterized protein n=1 Tax=Bradyrhizobium frederickii TaxID=2560054 RepID=A0A4Y9NN30_9BRAD|nr:hypothetical protein [Bradyrhizobium frederickii]TFV69299.1 hypothetical protein E4K64_33540 [Bradyrhizobium frederickii]
MLVENPDARKREQTEAQGASNSLNGLTVAEAFRKHVLEDEEVADLGRKVSRTNSAVFSEGQFPGSFVDFHWPLHATAETIAHAFVRQPIVFLGDPLPSPSDQEIAASRRLAERIVSFTSLLVRCDLIAIGTAAATGLEAPIGRGQWTRSDLLIDVQNSAVCEMRNHRPVPVWTGVWLQLPDQQAVISERAVAELSPEPTRARKQIQTKEKSRRECLDWLSAMMSDRTIEPMSNDQLWSEAETKWPGTLSAREFVRCRANALSSLSEEQRYLWERPGPRRKRS